MERTVTITIPDDAPEGVDAVVVYTTPARPAEVTGGFYRAVGYATGAEAADAERQRLARLAETTRRNAEEASRRATARDNLDRYTKATLNRIPEVEATGAVGLDLAFFAGREESVKCVVCREAGGVGEVVGGVIGGEARVTETAQEIVAAFGGERVEVADLDALEALAAATTARNGRFFVASRIPTDTALVRLPFGVWLDAARLALGGK